MSKARVILHVDMNSFYASVEMAYDPALKGKPLAIAGNPEERRGIIVTCSYEARKFGVKTTMPLWEARKKCPELLVMRPNFDRYRKASKAMFDLLRSYTHLVEPVSIDEGYMDITDVDGDPLRIIQEIQDRILRELDLPCSIGVAPSKFLAKMASDMKKPLGITILRKRDLQKKLWPLPARAMHGVGEKTAEKLKTIGIETIEQLATADTHQLKLLLGINGERLQKRANGIDDRAVDPDSIYDLKSVGHSTTLPYDVTDENELMAIFTTLSQKVSARLKAKELLGYGISIMIRFPDRKTITRSMHMEQPSDDAGRIFAEVRQLFLTHWDQTPIRLLGVTCHDLIERQNAVKQLDLFTYEKEEKKHTVDQLYKDMQARFGDQVISRGKKEAPPKPSAETSFSKDFFRDHD